MKMLRKIAMVVFWFVVLNSIMWVATAHPVVHNSPAIGIVQVVEVKQGSRWESHTSKYYDATTGIHIFSVTQNLSWDWGKTVKYPHGRAYNIDASFSVWTNGLTLWKYDGVVNTDSHFMPYLGWPHYMYQYQQQYEFHQCILWACQYSYPAISQVGYYGGHYLCWYSNDPAVGWYSC